MEEAFPGQNASGKGLRRGLRAKGGLECVDSSQISWNTRRKGAFFFELACVRRHFFVRRPRSSGWIWSCDSLSLLGLA